MPVISFLSGKGGVGKTTAALILATELSEHTAVTVIDADPNAPFTKWMKQRDDTGNIELINHTAVNMDNIEEVITDAAGRSTFVVVDLEGVKTLLNSYAAGASDLIVIPTQGSQLDAVEAASAIKLVSNLKNPVPYKLLLTRTNSAIRSRTLTNIEANLQNATYRRSTPSSTSETPSARCSHSGRASANLMTRTSQISSRPKPTPAHLLRKSLRNYAGPVEIQNLNPRSKSHGSSKHL